MKILLINPATVGYSRSVTAPLGLLSIASTLISKGYTVRLYDRTVEKVKTEEVFRTFSPDIVGVSLVSFKSIKDAKAVSKYAKKLSLPVIWGGPLASEIPETVLKEGCVDAVSSGEGEETWCEIAEAFEKGKRSFESIAGIVYKDGNGRTVFNEERAFIDLGTLPPIDWSLIDVPKYFQSSYECSKMLYLYCAKGCPHSCTFCYNKDFHKCTYRRRPLQDVLDEIKYLVENHGMDGVYFADEMWGRAPSEMRSICDSLKSLNLNFVWGCQTRIGVFSQEDFEYMYNSGCRWVFFGVESGSERVLEMMNKRIPFDKIEETVSNCRKAGIVTIASLIAGFPDETVEDLKKTVELVERLETSFVNFNCFALVPGSDIYKKMIAEGRSPEIKSLDEISDIHPIERNEYSFSEIPERDINVVRSWYMWRSFTVKDATANSKRFSFARKVITDALKQLKRCTLRYFIMSFINSGIEFLTVVYYAHRYPAIKKKYGINKK